ncbi:MULTISPECIES: AAA family ATPase [unclassified Adlercreutzia]|uniref:AAA family ATPase n=1 Tax=unclassified Adlercreutzia TaxID=2636013 RepID=UPI0013EC740C|nr:MULTISPECIES: AAA family ATPase [unclassified Adlercreutzia]
MRLAKIIIEGFRSFGERQTVEFDGLTTFIGENSSGKTAALAALGKIFAQRQADRQLMRSDFHLPKDMKPEDVDELELTVEAIFEFDELWGKS